MTLRVLGSAKFCVSGEAAEISISGIREDVGKGAKNSEPMAAMARTRMKRTEKYRWGKTPPVTAAHTVGATITANDGLY